MHKKLKLRIILLLPSLLAALLVFKPAEAEVITAPCDTVTYTNDDDGSFPLNLPFSLPLGNTTYNQMYVSTNGLLSFGSPDGTFWTYPNTPSLTVAGWDWVSWAGGYLRYGTSVNQVCIEWQVRQFPQTTGDFTNIKVVITVGQSGWQGLITTSGWTPANLRRGIRFESGQPIVPIDEAFIVNGGIPVEVDPTELPIPPTPSPTPSEPSPTSSPTPSPTETTSPSPSPTETVTPTPTPTASPTPSPTETETATPSPTPSETTSPSPTPTETQTQAPEPAPSQSPSQSPNPLPTLEPTLEPTQEPTPEPEPTIISSPESTPEVIITEPVPSVDTPIELTPEIDLSTLDPNQLITLENGVILEAGVLEVFQVLDSPTELVSQLFSNPGQVLEALGQLGADMDKQTREESQQVVVASVIVTQVLGAMTLTTTPPAPSGTSGGGGGGGGGGGEGKKKLKLKKKPKLKHRRRNITRHRRMK